MKFGINLIPYFYYNLDFFFHVLIFTFSYTAFYLIYFITSFIAFNTFFFHSKLNSESFSFLVKRCSRQRILFKLLYTFWDVKWWFLFPLCKLFISGYNNNVKILASVWLDLLASADKVKMIIFQLADFVCNIISLSNTNKPNCLVKAFVCVCKKDGPYKKTHHTIWMCYLESLATCLAL